SSTRASSGSRPPSAPPATGDGPRRSAGPSRHRPGDPLDNRRMSILVIDVGTSSLRAAVVNPDATIGAEEHRPLLPDTPDAGLVEFDAGLMAATALDLARTVLARSGPVEAVGITNQRASTIVWDRA